MVGNRLDVFAMFIMLSICLSCASVPSEARRAFFAFFSFLVADFLGALEEAVVVLADANPPVLEALDVDGGGAVRVVEFVDADFKAENERCGESKQLFFS